MSTDHIHQTDLGINELKKRIEHQEAELLALRKRLAFMEDVKALLLTQKEEGVPPFLQVKSSEKSISEFIVDFLSTHGPSNTKTIIAAYADYMFDEYKAVQNNVSNALSRLKGDEINGVDGGRGRKGGLVWSIKEKS